MTTTFHFETNEPQYEYSYEGADVQLRCQGLVAVAAGPAPAFDENVHCTWFELSPVSGKRILAGVGRSVPSATAASAFETRETMWANAMAGLDPLELVESSVDVGDSVYVLVDPTNGRVELGRAGLGTSALIFDGGETRLVPVCAIRIWRWSLHFIRTLRRVHSASPHPRSESNAKWSTCGQSREPLPLVRCRVMMRWTRS